MSACVELASRNHLEQWPALQSRILQERLQGGSQGGRAERGRQLPLRSRRGDGPLKLLERLPQLCHCEPCKNGRGAESESAQQEASAPQKEASSNLEAAPPQRCSAPPPQKMLARRCEQGEKRAAWHPKTLCWRRKRATWYPRAAPTHLALQSKTAIRTGYSIKSH